MFEKFLRRSLWADVGIVVVYAIGVGVYTFPLVLDFSRPFSEPGDYLLIAYSLSWQMQALLTHPWDFFQANVMYPTASSLAVATPLNTSQLMFFFPAKVFSGDSIVAINCVYVGNIFATAVSTFAVARHAGAGRGPAFVAGWSFGFAVAKMFQHFQFPFFWLVWVCYAWYCFLTTRKRSWLIVSAVGFVGMSLGSFYLMYMGFLCLLAATVVFHWKVKSLFDRRTIVHVAGAGVLVALFLVPFGWPYFEVNKAYNLKRPLGEAVQYSADPLGSYLLPNNDSVLYEGVHSGEKYDPLPGEEALFATLFEAVARYTGRDLTGGRYGGDLTLEQFHSIWRAGGGERRLFPGYSVLVLAMIGLFARASVATRVPRLLLCTLLIAGVALSLGPVIVSLGHLTYVPGPYALLYYVVPGLQGMRATARFGYVALLALSALSALGWHRMASRLFGAGRTRAGLRFVALAVWVCLFTAENLPARPQSHDRPQDPPPVYAYLAARDIDGGIIELPTFKGSMEKSDPVYGDRRIAYRHREYLYMYYSTFHWRPIYNGFGAFAGPHQFAVRDAVERLPDADAVALLRDLGLKTLVLHTYWFEAEDRAFWSRPEVMQVLEPVASVGGARVYRLVSGDGGS